MEKYKVLGFCTVHYSGDYMREALISVEPFVDKMVIAYSEKPSQGHSNNLPCPDAMTEIHQMCQEILGDKLIWEYAQSYSSEAHHRDIRYKHAAGFDIVLTCDSDEVMLGVPEAIEYLMQSGAQYVGIDGYVNFFRSFGWACYDGFRPIRIENLHLKNGIQDLNCKMTIYHFSCAQRKEVMQYKYKNFGHSSEIKHNYLEDVFYKWSPENNIPDLHPVAIGLWNAVPFDKKKLPIYMLAHPNFHKEIIE